MRPSCLECFKKHLVDALVLLRKCETSPTPLDLWTAIGHLDQCEEESCLEHLGLCQYVRHTLRLPLMTYVKDGEGSLPDIINSCEHLLVSVATQGPVKSLTSNPVDIPLPINFSNKQHIAAAAILLKESVTGYPQHLYLAVERLRCVKNHSDDVVLRTVIDIKIDEILKGQPTEVFSLISMVT